MDLDGLVYRIWRRRKMQKYCLEALRTTGSHEVRGSIPLGSTIK
jgi:hypothetical protein